MGGSENVQKPTYVIFEWSLNKICWNYLLLTNFWTISCNFWNYVNVTLKILCSLFYILYPMNFQLKVRSKWFWQNWSLFLSFKIFHCKTGIYRMKVDDGPNPTVYIRSWSLQEIKKNVAFFEHSFVLSQFLHNYRYLLMRLI